MSLPTQAKRPMCAARIVGVATVAMLGAAGSGAAHDREIRRRADSHRGLSVNADESLSTNLPGDCNTTGTVDLLDHEQLTHCLLGPSGGLPEEPCHCFDLDGDGDGDLLDVGLFQKAFTGPSPPDSINDTLDYFEDFENASAEGWALPPGWGVQATGGGFALRGDGLGHAHAEYPAGHWFDSRLRCRMRLAGDGLHLSHRHGETGRYFLRIDDAETVLNKQYFPDTFINGLASGPGMSYAQWHTVELDGVGPSLTVRIDGALVLIHKDDKPLPGGSISIESFFGELWLDDVAVYVPGIDLTWTHTGGPPGGLGYDIRMRPDNLDVMYVTDAWAGVFKSTNGGRTWFPANEGITVRTGGSGDAIPVFCLTIDPHDHDILWIGTQHERGIFKSTDAGANWSRMDDGVVEEHGITFRGFTVDPQSSDIVYAAAELSSWAWAGEERRGREFDMTQGVVYKTINGGESWEEVWHGDNLARYIWIDPRDPDVLYVSTGIFDREAANSDPDLGTPGGVGVIKSTDGGQTWNPANNGLNNLYVGSLFMHPENPDIFLAGTGNNQYFQGGGAYISTDGGASWQRTLVDENINSVEFAASNPSIAYAGSAGSVFRSGDGGLNWDLVSGGTASGWGSPGIRAGFPIDFQVDPRDSSRIFANNYGGGNFLSTDGGVNWTQASEGYTGAQIRDIDIAASGSGEVFAAARSGIFKEVTDPGQWVGLGYPPAVVLEWTVVEAHPTDPQRVLAATNWDGLLFASSNGGEAWNQVAAVGAEGLGWRTISFSTASAGIVYAGTGAFVSAGGFSDDLSAAGVYVSSNGGGSWVPANDTTSADAHVTSLACHPDNQLLVYAATTNHGILKTETGGTTWSERNVGLPGTPPVALKVVIHPAEADVVYAGLSGAGLYRSVDAGGVWQPLGTGMSPQASISDIVFDPIEPATMYAADRFSGVYRSTNGGELWRAINDGLRMRDVNALAITSDGRHLYAATEGGGVYRLDVGDP